MKKLLCVAILYTLCLGATDLRRANAESVAFKHPASASDLNNFYRSIQALSGDALINDTAAAIV